MRAAYRSTPSTRARRARPPVVVSVSPVVESTLVVVAVVVVVSSGPAVDVESTGGFTVVPVVAFTTQVAFLWHNLIGAVVVVAVGLAISVVRPAP